MSIYVMAPVLKATLPSLKGAEGNKGVTAQTLKLVALALADSANDDGTGAYPGIRSIADAAQCHTSTAVRALRHLGHLGAITQTDPGGPGRRARYTVHAQWFMDRIGIERGRRALPVLRAPDAQDACASQARKVRAPETRTLARPRGAQLRPITSVTPSGTPPVDDGWFRCIHPGCLLRVDPREHRARCREHDVQRTTDETVGRQVPALPCQTQVVQTGPTDPEPPSAS